MVYVLIVDEKRSQEIEESGSDGRAFTETTRDSSTRYNEMVLVQFRQQFTHMGTADSKAKRMMIREIRALPRAIPLLELPGLIPRRFITHAIRVFHQGGRLPPKTGEAILAALAHVLRE